MNHDIDIKKLRINCFRQSKVAGVNSCYRCGCQDQ